MAVQEWEKAVLEDKLMRDRLLIQAKENYITNLLDFKKKYNEQIRILEHPSESLEADMSRIYNKYFYPLKDKRYFESKGHPPSIKIKINKNLEEEEKQFAEAIKNTFNDSASHVDFPYHINVDTRKLWRDEEEVFSNKQCYFKL